MAEDAEVVDAGFSGAAVFTDEVGIVVLAFCELIIHHSCRVVSLIGAVCVMHSSVSFVSGLLAYITFMCAV